MNAGRLRLTCCTMFQCDCCGKPAGEKSRRFTLLHPWTGRHDVLLCRDCAGSLSWRADAPILTAAAATDTERRYFAGPMVNGLSRRLHEARGIRLTPEGVKQTAPQAKVESKRVHCAPHGVEYLRLSDLSKKRITL